MGGTFTTFLAVDDVARFKQFARAIVGGFVPSIAWGGTTVGSGPPREIVRLPTEWVALKAPLGFALLLL